MAGDRLVKSVADAQAAGRVSLRFRDGGVDAVIDGSEPSAPLEKPSSEAISTPSRAPRKAREPQQGGQQDLFS
jgi:exodeoxyribonuclease VII large subunit